MIELKVRDIEVGKLIGESPIFRVYLGTAEDGQSVILKVAKTTDDGPHLAKEAGRFVEMQNFAEVIHDLEEQQDDDHSCYEWLFANLKTTFLEETQGYRRINVFSMKETDMSTLTPLVKLQSKTEIDARTSVWVLGRLFKFYGFFELLGIEESEGDSFFRVKYPVFSASDYLIGPERHRLIYYNYSDDEECLFANDDVKAIAEFILSWVVIEDNEEEQAYLEFIKELAEKGRETFEQAHRELYHLIDEIWGRKYHPFTYRDRGSLAWKTIGR